MVTDLAETIYSKVKSLPLHIQKDVLNFVDELKLRSEKKIHSNGAGIEQLWREIDEIVAAVPEDAWNDLPTDGWINVDPYP